MKYPDPVDPADPVVMKTSRLCPDFELGTFGDIEIMSRCLQGVDAVAWTSHVDLG